GKNHDDPDFDRLSLLPALLPVYGEVLAKLRDAGAQWVQFDEPALVLDRTPAELAAVERAYTTLASAAGETKLLVQTYFGDTDESFHVLRRLPVAGLGLDLRRGARNIELLRRQ